MSYSQNNEEEVLLRVFPPPFLGRFLDIGAFDGKTLSCTYKLAELGWYGVCVEPSPTAFVKLLETHKSNSKIQLVNSAVAFCSDISEFFDSGGDLVSSLNPQHVDVWTKGSNCKFTKFHLLTVTANQLLDYFGEDFDFLKIDIEGDNFGFFKSFPLARLYKLRAICIEHDHKEEEIAILANQYHFKMFSLNAENLILTRQL